MQAVRASATMPYISPMVMIDGVPYLDGGCSCKIPYEWALQKGFPKILVIRTREAVVRRIEGGINGRLFSVKTPLRYSHKGSDSSIGAS
jgi:predicted patatin/cPLA2 family phospholipase